MEYHPNIVALGNACWETSMWRCSLLSLLTFVIIHGPTSQWSAAQQNSSDPPALQAIGQEAYDAIVRFYDYDKTIPLLARVVERKDSDNWIREKFVLRGVRGFLVPGYLERPKDCDGPAPIVLLLHGWSGSKDSWWQDGGYISGGNMRRALLNAGYAVLAIDAPTHGDRIAENDYALVNDLSKDGQPSHRNYFTVSEIVSQGTRDYRRALDLIESRDDLDSSRIGMIGYSMGGWQSFLLTAVDPRIRVSVACVVPSLAGESTSIAPKDYARGIGDRPFLMLMGHSDPMCHPQHAKQLLDLIPGDRKKLVMFESGHKLPSDYVSDALAWLEHYLK